MPRYYQGFYKKVGDEFWYWYNSNDYAEGKKADRAIRIENNLTLEDSRRIVMEEILKHQKS